MPKYVDYLRNWDTWKEVNSYPRFVKKVQANPKSHWSAQATPKRSGAHTNNQLQGCSDTIFSDFPVQICGFTTLVIVEGK